MALKEVRLLEKTKEFVLVFGDGSELSPRSESKRKEWYLAHRDVLIEYVNARLRGRSMGMCSPSGYSGTGSHNLAALLRSCGFQRQRHHHEAKAPSTEFLVAFSVAERRIGRARSGAPVLTSNGKREKARS